MEYFLMNTTNDIWILGQTIKKTQHSFNKVTLNILSVRFNTIGFQTLFVVRENASTDFERVFYTKINR